MAEWSSADSLAARIADLTEDTASPYFSASRLNGNYFLLGGDPDQTVFQDFSSDSLTGGSGPGLVFANSSDTLNSLTAADMDFIINGRGLQPLPVYDAIAYQRPRLAAGSRDRYSIRNWPSAGERLFRLSFRQRLLLQIFRQHGAAPQVRRARMIARYARGADLRSPQRLSTTRLSYRGSAVIRRLNDAATIAVSMRRQPDSA